MRRLVLALLLATCAWIAAARAHDAARVPGLLRLSAPPLVVHHAPEQAPLAEAIAARGPGDVARLALGLGLPVPTRIDVYIVPERAGDPERHGLRGAPDWAGGYALVDRPEIVLRTTRTHGPTGNDAATILTHELVHCLVSQAVGARRHDELPAWFVEGLASHEASEWRLVHSAQASGLALLGGAIPLRQIEHAFPPDAERAQLAYLQSFAFLQWLTERSGEDAPRRLLAAFRGGASFDDSFREAFGRPWSELEDEWVPGFLVRHRWIPVLTSSATLWVAVVALFVAGGLFKRRRAQARLREWEEEERLLFPGELPLLQPPIDPLEAAPDSGDGGGAEEEPRPEPARPDVRA